MQRLIKPNEPQEVLYEVTHPKYVDSEHRTPYTKWRLTMTQLIELHDALAEFLDEQGEYRCGDR